MRRVLFVLFLLLLLPAKPARAQALLRATPDSMVAQLTLADGSVLVGRVLDVTDTTIRFISSIGVSTIQRSTIRGIRVVPKDMVRDGQVWPEDPSRSRLLFAPTGRMMHQGEAYLTDAYVFFPSVQYGLTDQFSIGIGASIFPTPDITDNILYITPKLGVYQSKDVNVS